MEQATIRPHRNRTSSWAVIAHELFRIAMMVGLLVGAIWAYKYSLNSKSRLLITVFGFMWAAGCVLSLRYYAQVYGVWKTGEGSLVSVLQQKAIQHRKEIRTYREPKREEGKARVLAAWALPVTFGVPALLMLVLAPIVVFEPKPFRPYPLVDLLILEILPVLILTGIGLLFRRCKQYASSQEISFTDALYEWYRKYFQVNPAKRAARTPSVGKRTRKILAVTMTVIGAVALKFDLMQALGEHLYRRHQNVYTIIDLFPWLLVLIGIQSFLEELRFED